jgi:uncharacterized coiled-coil protein SlyX
MAKKPQAEGCNLYSSQCRVKNFLEEKGERDRGTRDQQITRLEKMVQNQSGVIRTMGDQLQSAMKRTTTAEDHLALCLEELKQLRKDWVEATLLIQQLEGQLPEKKE